MAAPPLANGLEGGINGNPVTVLDQGDPNGWDAVSGTAPTYTNVHAHLSALSMVWTNISTIQNVRWASLGSITGNLYSRFYMWVDALPAASIYPIQIRTAADTASCMIRVQTNGLIDGRDPSDSQIFGSDGSVAIATGQWIRIETRTLNNVASSEFEWRLFNIPDSTSTSDTKNAPLPVTLGADADRVLFGANVANPSALTIYFDDLAVSTTGWIGPTEGVQPSDDPPIGFLGRGAGW